MCGALNISGCLFFYIFFSVGLFVRKDVVELGLMKYTQELNDGTDRKIDGNDFDESCTVLYAAHRGIPFLQLQRPVKAN